MSRFYLQNISRYNNLVFPVATYTASVIFIFSYSVIFVELRKSSKNNKIQKSVGAGGTVALGANSAAGAAAAKDEAKTEVYFKHVFYMSFIRLSYVMNDLIKKNNDGVQNRLYLLRIK